MEKYDIEAKILELTYEIFMIKDERNICRDPNRLEVIVDRLEYLETERDLLTYSILKREGIM